VKQRMIEGCGSQSTLPCEAGEGDHA
jgi:hypothetical protein